MGGMPARRAASTLFAIENRTARLVVRSKRAVERYVSERAAAQQEADFLAALAEGRDPPMRPSIQDIERHAGDWAALVSPDPSLRAAVAHQLAAKYRFRQADVPRLRSALSLSDGVAADAHARLFGAPLESIYVSALTRRERAAWTAARFADRLESLSPAWVAFALTLTETVGAGVLALPIALAGLGILPAIGLLVVFGLVNLITIAALVESINRDGAIRYGSAYFGRLVEDYLGSPGRAVLSVSLFAINALCVVSYVIGLGLTLGGLTGTPPLAWVAGLGVVTLLVLRRGSLDATVATAMLIGFVNIALLTAIAGVGLTHLDVGRVAALPRVADLSVLSLVFGVLLTAYFGHTSAGTAAKFVLARDPSGRSLMRGNLAAMALAIVLYSVVLVGVSGAVPAADLAGFSGTAIEPLARVAGPAVTILGGAFVVLAMGLATVMSSLGLYSQTREIIAERPQLSALLRRGSRSAWLAASMPVVAAFLAVPLMMATGRGSFSGPIGILGTLATPVLGGVFPMLMVLSARRRGEYASAIAPRLLGNPVTVFAVVALFATGVLVQGWVVSQDPALRLGTVLVVILIGIICILAARANAFRRRGVLEIRADGRDTELQYSLVSAGSPEPVAVSVPGEPERATSGATSGWLGAMNGSAAATFTLQATGELAIWAHRVTDAGDLVPIALAVAVEHAGGAADALPMSTAGRGTAMLGPGPAQLTIRRATVPVAVEDTDHPGRAGAAPIPGISSTSGAGT